MCVAFTYSVRLALTVRRPSDSPDQVKLCSGDLLIFGGPARLIHHGVTRILIKSTPDFLVLPQPARINLTFRET
jgi:alkylated DNA repair protein (DNA oxidative demethylase)